MSTRSIATLGLLAFAVFAVASCAHVGGGALPTVRQHHFQSLAPNLPPGVFSVGFRETGRYPTAKNAGSVRLIEYGITDRLPFDGEYVYFPYYIVQDDITPSVTRYREPQHTIIGAHFSAVSLRTGVTLGPRIVTRSARTLYRPDATFAQAVDTSDYSTAAHFFVGTVVPHVLTDQTVFFRNQDLHYHPGISRLPEIEPFLPPIEVAALIGGAQRSRELSRLDQIPVRVLAREDADGYSIELINERYSFFLGFRFDQEYRGEILFLRFSTYDDLLRHLTVTVDADGFDLRAGFNGAGFRRDGTHRSGARFDGEINADGRTGFGVYHEVDGSRTEALFVENKEHGLVRRTTPDGAVLFGYYENGSRVTPEYVVRKHTGEITVNVDGVEAPYITPVPGLPENWILWLRGAEYQGISGDSRMRITSVEPTPSGGFVSIELAGGVVVNALVVDGTISDGLLLFPGGDLYIGELIDLRPNGVGTYVTSQGTEFAGRFTSDARLSRLTAAKKFLNLSIAYPAADSVGVYLFGPDSPEIALTRTQSGLWTGRIEVAENAPLAIELAVNGRVIDDEDFLASLHSITGVTSLLENPVTTPTITASIHPEQHVITPESVPTVVGPDTATLRSKVDRATRDYFGFARDVRQRIANERAAAFARTMEVVGQALVLTTEVMVEYAAAVHASTAQPGVAAGGAGGTTSAPIAVRPPAWTRKPAIPPGSSSLDRLPILVEAADRYYDEYAKAARAGDANTAQQLWNGHVASVRQAEDFARTLQAAGPNPWQ